jgi:hypothetical protein
MLSIGAVEIGDSLQRGLDELVAFLPRLVGFLIILLIGWLIARAVKALIVKALQGVGIDRALSGGSAGPYVARAMPDARPSEIIGTIAFWFLFLGAIAIAVSQLGISALDNFIQAIAAYLPNVVVAILIFVLAGAIAAAVSGLISRTLGDTATGKIAATAAPVLSADHGHRDVHDPRPAEHRARDRRDHLHRPARLGGARDGNRLRARWPRCGGPPARGRLSPGSRAA